MAPLATGPDGVYMGSVSSIRDIGTGLFLVRVQRPTGQVGHVVVPDTLADPHGVRIAVGAALALLERGQRAR